MSWNTEVWLWIRLHFVVYSHLLIILPHTPCFLPVCTSTVQFNYDLTSPTVCGTGVRKVAAPFVKDNRFIWMNCIISSVTGTFKGNVNGTLRLTIMSLHSFWQVIMWVYVCCAFLMLSATNSEMKGNCLYVCSCVYQNFKNKMGYSNRTGYKYLYSIKRYFQIMKTRDWSGTKLIAYFQL